MTSRFMYNLNFVLSVFFPFYKTGYKKKVIEIIIIIILFALDKTH